MIDEKTIIEKYLAKNYNVLLEGCDGVGKTSVANELQKHGFKIRHCVAPKSCSRGMTEYERLSRFLNSHSGYVFDRALLGECVYSPIKRNYYPSYMRVFERHLYKNTILVLLVCDYEELRRRFDGKFIKQHQLVLVQEMYKNEFEKSKYQTKILIDTTIDDMAGTTQKILEFINNLDLKLNKYRGYD